MSTERGRAGRLCAGRKHSVSRRPHAVTEDNTMIIRYRVLGEITVKLFNTTVRKVEPINKLSKHAGKACKNC